MGKCGAYFYKKALFHYSEINLHDAMICGHKHKQKLCQELLQNEPMCKTNHDVFCLLVKSLVMALTILIALG